MMRLGMGKGFPSSSRRLYVFDVSNWFFSVLKVIRTAPILQCHESVLLLLVSVKTNLILTREKYVHIFFV